MEGEIYIERRKFKRVEKKCQIKYRIISGEQEAGDIKREAGKRDSASEDLSIGGLRMAGDAKGNVGDIIRIEMKLDSGDEVTTFAEIKWIKTSGDGKEFGLEFLILKDKDKMAIESITENN